MTSLETAVHISLELDTENCREFGQPLYEQLANGYDVCAVQEIPDDIQDWRDQHRTARKRANRATRRGYYAKPFERHGYEHQIHWINNSASRRQGRPMTPSYRAMQRFTRLPDYPCDRHAIRTTGVFTEGPTLVGYLVMYRAGDLALVSQILGHDSYLRDEIMFLLFQNALVREIEAGPGVVVYNRWNSGTDGLRTHKRMLGFEQAVVEWHQ